MDSRMIEVRLGQKRRLGPNKYREKVAELEDKIAIPSILQNGRHFNFVLPVLCFSNYPGCQKKSGQTTWLGVL